MADETRGRGGAGGEQEWTSRGHGEGEHATSTTTASAAATATVETAAAETTGAAWPTGLEADALSPTSHRISTFADLSLYPGHGVVPYDPIGPATAPVPPEQLREAPSLVSLSSGYHAPTAPATTSSTSWADADAGGDGGGYASVPQPPASMTTRTPSRTGSRSVLGRGLPFERRRRESTMEEGGAGGEEEGIAMSLLPWSAPIDRQALDDAGQQHSYAQPRQHHWDELFLKTNQEQEAMGNLSGGLGMGFKVDATMQGRELLDKSQQMAGTAVQQQGQWHSSIARTLGRTKTMMLTRRDTIRGLGQDEADRRGQVIEVVVEEDGDGEDGMGNGRGLLDPNTSGVDLTFVTGPATLAPTQAKKRQRTEVFYPKGNWRPFSMRAPYLVALIVLSLVLALAQEVLYQRFHQKAMFTFRTPSELGSANYFAVKFLPMIVTVSYGVLWQVTDFEVMRLEAFYQLSKPGGALAGQSINVDYVAAYSVVRPFRALKLGHYAVAVSSVATTLAVSLVPTFGAASLTLEPGRAARLADPDMVKSIHVRETWSRLLTATLLLCAVFCSVLLFLLQSRKSGLVADVRGIAGVASMAVASHILNDFRDLDTAKPRDIHDRLKRHRYVLRNASLAPDDGDEPPSLREQERFGAPHLSENPHPVMLRARGTVPFVVGLALFAGFVPVFLFTPAAAVTDKAPFIITALAVVVKMTWGAMETAVRMMEPYYLLSRRHAPPRTLTLDYAAMPFGKLAAKAFFNGHSLMFFVGFGTVMAEFLTILVTSLSTVDGRDFLGPVFGLGRGGGGGGGDDDDDTEKAINSGQETTVSFLVAFALVMFILVYMVVVATVVFARRRHPFLPRQPNTIASVLAFIHQSKMLWDFVDTARLSNADMARHVVAKGKTYGLGWYQGRDGQMHCGVDEEELALSYKHGVDYSQGNMPWNTRWDVL